MERPNSVNLILIKADMLTAGIETKQELNISANGVIKVAEYIRDLEQRVEALQRENTCLSLFAK